jgi:S-DNA-T family DNA segregation ATPase FtsK/SpoIIIE
METQRALSHFSMQAEFADPKLRLTPNGALVAFRGHPTLTTEKIERRRGELLTTYGIEVADVRPGRGKIAVFVTREKRATVPLASTWLGAPWPDREPGTLTSFVIGAREDDDRLLHLNLAEPFAGYEAHGPHTLIAGETGSGKGILTQSLLLQLIVFNDPCQAELILVDPKKGVDFTWLDGAPHMRGAVITEMAEAEGVLDELVLQMDERYDRFASVGAANIVEYNRKVDAGDRMSRIFMVHDELGAWMAQEKDYQEVVLSAVANLGMKARAAGIHLILITQRADADAVPGRLRDNMGNRLCLKVQNSTGSRMVLGIGGAEKLLGKGHLACVLSNQPTPPGQEYFVVQVPFADSEDMRRLADVAKVYWRARKASG